MTVHKLMIWILVLGLSVVSARFVRAGEEEHQAGGQAQQAEFTIPDELPRIWAAVEHRLHRLEDLVADGELDRVHVVAFQIRDLVRAMPAKSGDLDARKQKTVRGGSERVGQVAALLDRYGDAGDKKNTQAQLKRLKSLLGYIEKQYPAHALQADGHGK